MAKRLRRASPKTGERLSYRAIASRLKDEGHVNEQGKLYGPQSVKLMVEG